MSAPFQIKEEMLTVSLIRLIAGASGGNRVGEAGRDRLTETLEDGAADEPAALDCPEI